MITTRQETDETKEAFRESPQELRVAAKQKEYLREWLRDWKLANRPDDDRVI